jgi:hypothetical protein
VYRTIAGNTGNYLLLTTVADNTTTTFSDTVADGSLGAAAPSSDTTPVVRVEMAGGAITATASGDVSACYNTTTFSLTQGSVCGTSLLADKDGILPLAHGLDYVMQMQPVSYVRKVNGNPEIGVIADWMVSIDPQLGTYNANTGTLANASDRAMIAVLIQAVKDQQAEIDDLKARLGQ